MQGAEVHRDEAALAPRPVETEAARILSVCASRLLRLNAIDNMGDLWSLRDIFGSPAGTISFEGLER